MTFFRLQQLNGYKVASLTVDAWRDISIYTPTVVSGATAVCVRLLACVFLAFLPFTGSVCGLVWAKTDQASWPPPQEVISADLIGGEGQGETAPKGTGAPHAAPSLVPAEKPAAPQLSDDPCLPGLYKDWRELSQEAHLGPQGNGFERVRIVIDRSDFNLALEGIRKDESVEEIYRTRVALGDIDSPTPDGVFIINHVYCYPDVIFFPADADPIPGLYNGFFAPLLACDEDGRCERFQELGLHGFQASALPNHTRISSAPSGAITAGCIRLPDPCKFKSALTSVIGLGPLKKNERGSYHWLNKPVEVVITGAYPGTEGETTISTMVEQGLLRLNDGLKSLWSAFQ